jgi:hypothetical protein
MPMPEPSIFVSHSCKDRLLDNPALRAAEAPDVVRRLKFARSVRDAIVAKAHPIRVWLDVERLEPGDAWSDEIVDGLAGCSAAVVVLTPESIASDWVLKEATILAYRRARNPKFQLVPVLLSGLSFEDLPAEWKAVGIDTWQAAVQGQAGGSARERSRIVAAVVNTLRKLAPVESDPAIAGWIEEVAAPLGRLARDDLTARLDRVADAVRFKSAERWEESPRAVRMLAKALIDADRYVDGAVPSSPLVAAASSLRGLRTAPPEDDVKRVLQYLSPACAPPAGAAALLRAVGAPPIVVIAASPRVVRLLINRAECGRANVKELAVQWGRSGLVLGASERATMQQVANDAQFDPAPTYVVVPLPGLPQADLDGAVQQLRELAPSPMRLVLAINRNPDEALPPTGEQKPVQLSRRDHELTLSLAANLTNMMETQST